MNKFSENYSVVAFANTILSVVELAKKGKSNNGLSLIVNDMGLYPVINQSVERTQKAHRLVNSELHQQPLQLVLNYEKYPELELNLQQFVSFDSTPVKSDDVANDILVMISLTPNGFLIEDYKEWKKHSLPKENRGLYILEYSDCIETLTKILEGKERFFEEFKVNSFDIENHKTIDVLRRIFERDQYFKIARVISGTKEVVIKECFNNLSNK